MSLWESKSENSKTKKCKPKLKLKKITAWTGAKTINPKLQNGRKTQCHCNGAGAQVTTGSTNNTLAQSRMIDRF